MIHIEEVKGEQKDILSNYLQKYLYEMSLYYGDEMDSGGNYKYTYLPYYFEEASRKAFFIYSNDKVIGFALINNHSFTGEQIDNCIAEFTIFPAYRHNGNGMKAIELIMKKRPGSWQLKYSSKNKPGMIFWKKVKEKYMGKETFLEENEIALTILAPSTPEGVLEYL